MTKPRTAATPDAPPPGSAPPAGDPMEPEVRSIRLDRIDPSPFQPRKTFDEDALAQLAESIRAKGVLQPVVLRPRTLWQRVVGFVARQRALYDAGGQGYGLSKAQFESAGIRFGSGQYDEAIDLLHEEGRVERAKVVNAWAPAEGALRPIGDRDRLGTGPERYELVAGERRVRASRMAGLLVVPAVVRELSDHDAAEATVVENDQREDVPPLEQAEGYATLVRMGDDAETIAAKIGRPVAYVTGRLQLTHLADKLKEDMRAGKLPFGHAWLLSRLQPADQLELRERLYQDWGHEKGQPCSIGELRQRIKNTRLHCLSAAPWKWDDESLVPEAGSCRACPKRSGNNRTLFDDLLNGSAGKKTDYCTDGACFRKKRAAFVELQVRTAAAANGGEALKLSTRWQPSAKGVIGCDGYEVLTRKELKATPADQVKTAVIVEGYEDDAVGKVVKVKLKKESKAKGSAGDSYRRQEAARRKKNEAYKAAALKANGIVAARVESVVGDPKGGAAAVKLLRHLAAALTGCGGADACRMVTKRRGLAKAKAEYGRYDNTRRPVEDLAHSLDDAKSLLGLVAEVIAAHESNRWCFSHYSGTMPADEKAFWSAFGVDRAKLVEEGEARQQEKKDAKKAKGKKRAKVAAE